MNDYNKAIDFYKSGHIEEAITALQNAISIRADYFDAYYKLGYIYQELGKHKEAITCFEQASALSPNNSDVFYNFGTSLLAIKDFAGAAEKFKRSITIDSRFADVYCNLGVALIQLGSFEEAIVSYEKALLIDSALVEAYVGLGAALSAIGQNAEAIEVCQKALAIKSNSPEVYINFGYALAHLNQHRKAIQNYRIAIELSPNNAVAHYNLSSSLLALGEYGEGWKEFKWRDKLVGAIPSPFVQPTWQGEPIAGKTILVRHEQGYGDTIQLLRYMPMLVEKGAQVLVWLPEELVHLGKRMKDITVIKIGDTPPPLDFQCPFMDLPDIFGTTVETIPNKIPYLSVDPEKISFWKSRVEKLPGKRRVGLVWAGNPRTGRPSLIITDKRRSVNLEQFKCLADAGISFVSLQKGEAAKQTKTSGMDIYDWSEELNDFSDTAALIEALDLVISVDTSIVHLAGALGKPIWLLNRYDSCWRWFMNREDSPWYPTIKIFHQSKLGDWVSVFERVKKELNDY